MKDLSSDLQRALTSPTAEGLWRLRGDLLEAGLAPEAGAFRVLGEFAAFLDELATSTSSREYSHLASMMDIGALGGVLLEQLLEPTSADQLAQRVFAGALSEGLMVLATRQHVKAWEGELGAVYRRAAWFLYQELWRWARERKPDLPSDERRRLLDRLMSPIHSSEASADQKAVLIGHLFQVLLLSELSGEMARLDGGPGARGSER
jgi:hypothetical protein